MDGITHFALGLAALLVTQPAAVAPPGGVVQRPQPVPHADPADAWFGEDKFRHFTMSLATTSFAFAGLRSLGAGDAAPGGAAAIALAAGIAKEFYDVRVGRSFSYRDLAWDVAGVLAGYALARNGR